MKRVMHIYLILVAGYYLLDAQTCEECRNKPFCYYFCREVEAGLRVVAVCTSDPYAARTGYKLWKMCLKPTPTIRFVGHPFINFRTPGIGFDYNGNGRLDPYEVYFTRQEAEQLVTVALNRWLSICDPKDTVGCSPCSLQVYFTTDPAAFRGEASSTPATMAFSLTPDCRPSCRDLIIWINITQDFIGWDPPDDIQRSRPTRYGFYTNTNSNWRRVSPIPLVDLLSVYLHEIGHWLGFGHPQECGCGDSSGVMRAGIEPFTEYSITYDERCMFMKLYCCPQGSPVLAESNESSLYPNPVSSEQLSIEVEGDCADQIRYRIVSVTGTVMSEGVVDPAPDAKRQAINVGDLPVGVYLVSLDHCGQRSVQKVVVIR